MGVAKLKTRPASAGGSRRRKLADMRLVRGGTFRMGSDRFYPEEAPVRPASVGTRSRPPCSAASTISSSEPPVKP